MILVSCKDFLISKILQEQLYCLRSLLKGSNGVYRQARETFSLLKVKRIKSTTWVLINQILH